MLRSLTTLIGKTRTTAAAITVGIQDGNTEFFKWLTLSVIALQLVGCLAAILTDVMLHGDGAYFVFALAVDEPWTLKWRDIASRASIYVLTVLPTQWFTQTFALDPMAIAQVNAFFFYALPAVQLGIAALIVWRQHPEYLAFPIAQYVFVSSLGFGFPSEILVAPGFLWITLFLILTNRTLTIWFPVAFTALLFTHELTFPSALLTIVLAAYMLNRQGKLTLSNSKVIAVGISVLGAVGCFLWALLDGGTAGSGSNAIYVLDPRRILNNPSLWLIVTIIPLVLFLNAKTTLLRTPQTLAALIVGALLFPLILQILVPSIDFEQGRYDSTRTLIGAMMFALALVFCVRVTMQPQKTSVGLKIDRSFPVLAYTLALSLSVGAAIAFLRDWTLVREALDTTIERSETAVSTAFVKYSDVHSSLTQAQLAAHQKIGFHWALPYQSMVIADGKWPRQIVYPDNGNLKLGCRKLSSKTFERSVIPTKTIEAYAEFACAKPPPPPRDSLSARFFRAVKSLFGM